MIIWEFDGGQPYVLAVVGIPRLRVFGAVRLLVDTGDVVTCIHPKDGIPLRLPFDCLQHGGYVTGVGGRSRRFVEWATLTFADADGAVNYAYAMDIRDGNLEQSGSRLPSLLGQKMGDDA